MTPIIVSSSPARFAAAAVSSATADAQTFGEPLCGSHWLEAGFLPDPHTVEIVADCGVDLASISVELQMSSGGVSRAFPLRVRLC